MELVTTNMSGSVRKADLEGRPHLVVPMVMITEGVHQGSAGPLLYPGEELAKTPAVWNHKPIVVYHPEANGVGVSACDPAVLNTRKVGLILNTKYEGNKLKAEAWVEEERLKAVDQRVMDAIVANSTMELSTGLFTDNIEESGEWNGKAYGEIARNYRPDHLAILPDQEGACSVADGAGFLRLNQAMGVAGFDGAQRILASINKTLAQMGLVGNMSDGNNRQALRRALREVYKGGVDSPWIVDVFTDKKFVIFEHNGKLWKQSFKMVSKVPTLTGAMEEVIEAKEYRTVSGAFVGNADDGKPTEEPAMGKKEIVDSLIANKQFDEDKREELMAMDQPYLEAMVENKKGTKGAAGSAAKKGYMEGETGGKKKKSDDDEDDDDGTKAKKAKKAKAKELVDNLADAMGVDASALTGAITGMVANATTTKAGLVAGLVANSRCNLTEAVLNGMDVATLGQLTKDFAQPAVHNYQGAAGAALAGFNQQPVNNAEGDDDDEPLMLPTMNFGTEDKD